MLGGYIPKYVLLDDNVFKRKLEQASSMLKSCDLCPRQCKVDRNNGGLGYCHSGNKVQVSHWQLHYGEEPPLSAASGAGTIFFAHCNMHCVYCQNHQISQQHKEDNPLDPAELAEIMLDLQQQGAQNIDLVSPTHFMPQIIKAVYHAKEKGLNIPLVYNTNGYELETSLDILDGIVDIYMPDLKYDSEDAALSYSDSSDYVYYAKKAVMMMYEQTGELVLDDKMRALSGLLIRHLVLPNGISSAIEVLDFIKNSVSKRVGLSLMSQYAPCYQAGYFKQLDRCLTKAEYEQLVDHANDLGLEHCWIQQIKSNDVYFPDFDQKDVF